MKGICAAQAVIHGDMHASCGSCSTVSQMNNTLWSIYQLSCHNTSAVCRRLCAEATQISIHVDIPLAPSSGTASSRSALLVARLDSISFSGRRRLKVQLSRLHCEVVNTMDDVHEQLKID